MENKNKKMAKNITDVITDAETVMNLQDGESINIEGEVMCVYPIGDPVRFDVLVDNQTFNFQIKLNDDSEYEEIKNLIGSKIIFNTKIKKFTENGHPKEFRNVITYEKNGQEFGPYNRLSKKIIKKECSLESYVVNLSSFRNIKTVEVQLLDYMDDKFILYENNFDDFYNLLAQSLINRSWKIRIYWKNQTSSPTNKQITKVEKV